MRKACWNHSRIDTDFGGFPGSGWPLLPLLSFSFIGTRLDDSHRAFADNRDA